VSSLPAAGYLSTAARTRAEMKTAFEDVRDVVAEGPGGGEESTLTIATGDVTPGDGAARHFRVATEAAAATDDLDHILYGAVVPAGALIRVRAATAGQVVVLKHQTAGNGNMTLADDQDVALETADEFLEFVRSGTTWVETFRSLLNRPHRVLEITQVAASPKVLVPSDNGKYLKGDAAAAATNYATLPAATAGLRFPFGTDSAQKLRLTAAGTNTIQRRGTTSGAGGFYETAAEDGFQGELLCWKTGQWMVRFEEAAGAGSVT